MHKYMKIGETLFKKDLIKRAIIDEKKLSITYLKPKVHMDEIRYCLTTYTFKDIKYNVTELYSCPNIIINTIKKLY